jgi:hypothetical protein
VNIDRHVYLAPARLLVVAAVCAPALLCGVGKAGAEAVVPVEGPWAGLTSAGFAVTFRVESGSVVDAHWGFESGPCGNQASRVPNTDPIDAEGHWSFESPEGPLIEGTFVAPDRVEGVVSTIDRAGPICHGTRATFTAAPGKVPPPAPPRVYAVQNPRTGHQAHMPEVMTIGRDLSFLFYRLRWNGYGKSTARGTGHAQIRRFKKEWNPRVTVWLSSLIGDGPGKQLYSEMRYSLSGPTPAGYPRKGWFRFDRHGVVADSQGHRRKTNRHRG